MRTVLLVLVLTLLAPLALRTVHAEDDPLPPGMTEDQVRVLKSKLRKRSAEWWRYRKKLAQRCP